MPDPISALQAQVRAHPGEPLLTHYDGDSRIELSVKTFANWVDKTTSLIDNLGITQGSPIWLPVLAERPDHWTSLVWVGAAWQFGSPVTLEQGDAELAVVTSPEPVAGLETVACSLHPLGLGFPTEIAATDFREVLAMPDAHWRNPAPATWGVVTPEESGERWLLGEPHDPERSVRALFASLIGGGSLVLVRGGDEASIARSERAAFSVQQNSGPGAGSL